MVWWPDCWRPMRESIYFFSYIPSDCYSVIIYCLVECVISEKHDANGLCIVYNDITATVVFIHHIVIIRLTELMYYF